MTKGGSWKVGDLWVTPLPDGTWAVTGPGGGRTVVTRAAAAPDALGPVKSPMAGVVTAILVAIGEAVDVGQELVVVEAMKMRFAVTAKAPGVVSELGVQAGDRVAAGQALLALRPL
ncbi:MAG: biotin/lipoyl-binding protein [Cyanobacteria bacterium RYN_339]|nr:biotin/lipoyl-binding protein [Cyanobacteria bacterium RYN_339]